VSKASEKKAESEAGDQNLFAAALLMAQTQMRNGVAKDARVDYGKGYDYVSAEQMIGAARAALHAAQLALVRTGWQFMDGSEARPPLVLCDYTLKHVSGEQMQFAGLPWPIIEQNGRPLDKALAGALTTSLAYFLRDLLMIPKVDGEEVDRRDDSKHVAGVIGVSGAVALRKRLKDENCEISELLAVMNSKGINPPEDMAQWSSEFMPRISQWLLKRRRDAEQAAVNA
jgi:hypothetical protein